MQINIVYGPCKDGYFTCVFISERVMYVSTIIHLFIFQETASEVVTNIFIQHPSYVSIIVTWRVFDNWSYRWKYI